MKKETLEEAFNKIVDSSDYVLFDYASFEEGAKWQAERSYSEEEVLNILEKRGDDLDLWYNSQSVIYPKEKEWFEQFKKK
jgi:hypothetical protein